MKKETVQCVWHLQITKWTHTFNKTKRNISIVSTIDCVHDEMSVSRLKLSNSVFQHRNRPQGAIQWLQTVLLWHKKRLLQFLLAINLIAVFFCTPNTWYLKNKFWISFPRNSVKLFDIPSFCIPQNKPINYRILIEKEQCNFFLLNKHQSALNIYLKSKAFIVNICWFTFNTNTATDCCITDWIYSVS